MTLTTSGAIRELKELWTMLFAPAALPDDPQWAIWFLQHQPGTVREGIVQLAKKHRKLDGNMDTTYMVKFASAVMNRLTRTSTCAALVTPETPQRREHAV